MQSVDKYVMLRFLSLSVKTCFVLYLYDESMCNIMSKLNAADRLREVIKQPGIEV